MNSNIWLRYAMVFSGSIFFPAAWQLIGIPAAWLLFDYPIGRLMIVSVEDRFLSPSPHPVAIHFIHLTSGVYFGTRFICLISFISLDHVQEENEIALIIIGVNFILIGCMYIFLLCYGIYFNTNIEKIVAKYDKEFNKERMDNNEEYYHISNSYQIMNNNIWLRYALIFFGALFIPASWQLIGIPVAWLFFGYPIGRLLIVSHKVEDRLLSPSTHPVVIHFIHLTSGLYVGACYIGLISLISLGHDLEENATALPKLTTVVGFCLCYCMYVFLFCYGIYFNTNIEKIVAKHDKEFNKELTGFGDLNVDKTDEESQKTVNKDATESQVTAIMSQDQLNQIRALPVILLKMKLRSIGVDPDKYPELMEKEELVQLYQIKARETAVKKHDKKNAIDKKNMTAAERKQESQRINRERQDKLIKRAAELEAKGVSWATFKAMQEIYQDEMESAKRKNG